MELDNLPQARKKLGESGVALLQPAMEAGWEEEVWSRRRREKGMLKAEKTKVAGGPG